MPKVRVIQQAPAPIVTSGSGVFRPIAAPTTLSAPQSVAAVPADDRAFMPDAGVADDEWAREVKRREDMENLAEAERIEQRTQPPSFLQPGQLVATKDIPTVVPKDIRKSLTDLASLPDRFTLDVERKADGWWKVTAPSVHTGLFVAQQDLSCALSDAPEMLAEILRLDGPLPQAKQRKRRNA